MNIECPISLGELIDKISILKIKSLKITDSNKLSHVKKEEDSLLKKLNELNLIDVDIYLKSMIEINLELWEIEDKIRDKERTKCFDQEFIDLARSVYVKNDERFKRKNIINQKYNSAYTEVKSYKEY